MKSWLEGSWSRIMSQRMAALRITCKGSKLSLKPSHASQAICLPLNTSLFLIILCHQAPVSPNTRNISSRAGHLRCDGASSFLRTLPLGTPRRTGNSVQSRCFSPGRHVDPDSRIISTNFRGADVISLLFSCRFFNFKRGIFKTNSWIFR